MLALHHLISQEAKRWLGLPMDDVCGKGSWWRNRLAKCQNGGESIPAPQRHVRHVTTMLL